MLKRSAVVLALASLVMAAATLHSQQPAPGQPPQQPVPSNKSTVYVIGTSHLDTQWNWTVQDTIRDFIPATFYENFDRFETYPDYAFSYEGAIHYMWFKEYYPDYWPTLVQYVNQNRWKIAGSWINAVDVNVPSPESLMRQALYGKQFFRREFGRVSNDIYLPDSFGFGFALPSIAAHSGLNTFVTQKLTWGSSVPIPFPLGRWKGVDGSEVIAALNPGDYVTKVRSDIATDPKWIGALTPVGDGKSIGLRLFGTGDQGGAPDAESIDWLEKSIADKTAAVDVRNTSPDQLARDLTSQQRALLPVYQGELTMKTHGVGTYTSQAAMKKFNRQNEQLADAAERASVAAEWWAGSTYPADRLREAWIRVLWHQFHDDLPGTCIPQAYQFSWNDELVSSNQFAGVLTSATSSVAGALDTSVQRGGVPLIVYNPLSMARREPVDATVHFPARAPKSIHVVNRMTGDDVPAQILESSGNDARILFLADVKSIGFGVFEVRDGHPSKSDANTLHVTANSLTNARYTVTIDANGDIASVIDHEAGKQLLRAPIRLEMRNDPSPDKPAWRILYDTVMAPAREFVQSPTMRIVENGPVRATIEITRHAAGSTFVQRVSLSDDGDRVDVENLVDWKSPNTLLKVAFPFAVSNPKATYDLGLGSIQRGNDTPDAYEVPAQQWADLTDTTNTFGTAVLNDSKYGWDKPADNVLRLTLLHTAMPRAYPYQSSNDLGHHRFVYSIAGHNGDWQAGRVPSRAASLNQPLVAFQTESHPGALGREVSLASLDDPAGQVAIVALKKAEDSDEMVVRVQEKVGRAAHVRLSFASPIASIREINAAEEPIRALAVTDGGFMIDLRANQPRSFAVRLARVGVPPPAPNSVALDLPFNLDGISREGGRADGDFDGHGLTLAGDLLPQELRVNDVWFKFGSTVAGDKNVLVPKGDTLPLPKGEFTRVYVVAAAVGGADVAATFGIERGSRTTETSVTMHEWQGPIGQWDSRLTSPRLLREVFVPPPMKGQSWTPEAIQADLVVRYDAATGTVSGMDQIRPGFVTRDEIAWVGSHRHAPDGDQIYIASYLFLYGFDLPAGATGLRLPSNDKVRILAVTAVQQVTPVRPSKALYSSDLPDKPVR